MPWRPVASIWDNPATDARLRVLRAEGLSAHEIALKLTEEFGVAVSRSGVTGKCARLGLASVHRRARPVKAAPLPSAEKARAEAGPPKRRMRYPEVETRSDLPFPKFETLAMAVARGAAVLPVSGPPPGHGACRWIFGHPSEVDSGWCGRDVAAGRVYCPDHCRHAYRSFQP